MKTLFLFIKFIFIQIVYRFFKLFPIKKNQIIFWSNSGRDFTCNPKYIINYLQNHYSTNDYHLIFASIKNEFINTNIETIKYGGLLFLYKIATSAVIIDNSGTGKFYSLRKGQLFIETWHGGGAYKKVGNAIKNSSKLELKISDYRSKNTSYYISSSAAFTKLHIIDSKKYFGTILPIGMPRNDIFFESTSNSQAIKNKVKKYFKTGLNRIVLYAPTKRDNTKTFSSDLNPRILLSALKKKFGGNWVLFIRSHRATNNFLCNMNSDCIINVSNYDDMQELLLAADILITDYSSSIWDFSITKKPCFLYVPDLGEYKSIRDFYYPIEEWGPAICRNNKELEQAIASFNHQDFINKMHNHQTKLMSYENGKASCQICAIIIKHINSKNKN